MGANKLNSEYGDLVAEYDELSDSDAYHAYDAQWSTEALDAESVTYSFKYTAFGLQTH